MRTTPTLRSIPHAPDARSPLAAVAALLLSAAVAPALAAPAAAQSLGLADLTLGTHANPTATALPLGHAISFEVSGAAAGELAVLLASASGPAIPLDLGGVPVLVDPLAHVVLGSAAVGALGQASFGFVVPPTMAIGSEARAQVALLDFAAPSVRVTNGLVLEAAGESVQTLVQDEVSSHPLAFPGGVVTVTSDAQWQAFWSQHVSVFPAPPAPSVDFGTHAVVCVFAGLKTSTGYEVSVDSIVFTGSALDVHATTQVPGAGCATGDALTQPVHFVLVDQAVAAPATLTLVDHVYTCG